MATIDQSFHRGYRSVGLFDPKPLPSQRGLFGIKLTLRSLIDLQADGQIEGGGFKHDIWEEYAHHQYGWPYDYENDLEYRTIMGVIKKKISGYQNANLEFLHQLKHHKLVLVPRFLTDPRLEIRIGPEQAPEPDPRQKSGYVWPSYIVWPNDPSYLSFLGSPETLELPKDVLRETRGHPEIRDEPSAHYRPGIQRPWRI